MRGDSGLFLASLCEIRRDTVPRSLPAYPLALSSQGFYLVYGTEPGLWPSPPPGTTGFSLLILLVFTILYLAAIMTKAAATTRNDLPDVSPREAGAGAEAERGEDPVGGRHASYLTPEEIIRLSLRAGGGS